MSVMAGCYPLGLAVTPLRLDIGSTRHGVGRVVLVDELRGLCEVGPGRQVLRELAGDPGALGDRGVFSRRAGY